MEEVAHKGRNAWCSHGPNLGGMSQQGLPQPATWLLAAPLSLQGACLGPDGGHLPRVPPKGPYFPQDDRIKEQVRNQSTWLLFFSL